jgi:hypothetical protein
MVRRVWAEFQMAYTPLFDRLSRRRLEPTRSSLTLYVSNHIVKAFHRSGRLFFLSPRKNGQRVDRAISPPPLRRAPVYALASRDSGRS